MPEPMSVRDVREVVIESSDQVAVLRLRDLGDGRVQVRFGLFGTTLALADLQEAVARLGDD